jgi:hypothetical protein
MMAFNREELVTMLNEGICEVTFTKVNGEVRVMPCTLQADLLPVVSVEKLKESKERHTAPDNLSVWCTDKNEWRSFKIANVTSVRTIAASKVLI